MKDIKRKKNKAGNPCQTLQLNNAESELETGNKYHIGRDEIYRRNLKALEIVNPELAGRVRGATISNYELVYTGPNTPPTIKIKSHNMNYYKVGDPLKDAEEQVQALGLKNTRLAVFLGMGLGYELLYYFTQMANKQNTNYILVIERDLEMFKAALKTVDLRHLLSNSRFEFMVGLPEEQLYVKLRKYLEEASRFIYLKAIKPVYHSSALTMNKDYYLQALKHLRESGAHQVLHFGNCPHDSLMGVENMLENIDEIVFNPGINLLLNKFRGKPAVVVSTGPSLNKNKHLLKGLEDKVLLVAADASLKVMLELGVKPHLVTSLERTIIVKKLMEGFDEKEVKEVYYASCPVIHSEVYQAYPGPRIIVYRNFDHFKWLGIDRGILNIQLSAGNMAFKVAEALGCNPIILIGQDLSYGRDGTTHALGTANTENGIVNNLPNRKRFEVTGNDGLPVLTDEAWYPCIKAYDLDIAQYSGTCINSTEGGAYFQGSVVMPFEESIAQYIKEAWHPLENIKKAISKFTSEAAENDYQKVMRLIEQTILDMSTIRNNCSKGFDLINKYKPALIKYLHKPDSEPVPVYELEKTLLAPKNDTISNYSHTYQLFFMHIIQSFNIKFEMEMIAIPEKYDKHELALAEIILRQGEWYSVIGDLAKLSLDILYKSKEKLSSRKPFESAAV